MKIVERAERPPAKCAVTADIDGPFIDTGAYCPNVDPYIYLHVPLVEQMAREMLGMVPKEDVEKLTEQVAAFGAQVDQMKAKIESMETLKALEQEVRA